MKRSNAFQTRQQQHGRAAATVILSGLMAVLLATGACLDGCSSDTTPPKPLPPTGSDIFAPAPITLTVDRVDNTEVVLGWLAPHDEPDSHAVARYDLRRFERPITAALWDSAQSLPIAASPKPAGQIETYVDRDLSPLTSWHYAIRSYDASDNPSLLSPSVHATTLCRPALLNFTENRELCADYRYEIRWEAPECATGFLLELFHENDFCAFVAPFSAEVRSYSWLADQCPRHERDHYLKLRTLANHSVRSGRLTIRPVCQMRLTAPRSVCEDDIVTLTWNPGPCCGDSVRLEVEAVETGVRQVLVEVQPNNGEFRWQVRRFEGLDEAARIHLVDLGTGRIASHAVDIARSECTFEVTSPLADDSYAVGSEVTIRWNGTCCSETVDLLLFHDGLPCRTIANGIPNNGTYLWVAERCEDGPHGHSIRIVGSGLALGESSTFSVSDQCLLTLHSLASNIHHEGYDLPIRWSANSLCESVDIDLLANGVVCASIARGEANDGAYDWVIPAPCGAWDTWEASTEYQVRLSVPDAPQGTDVSEPFQIVPYTIVLRPDGSGDYPTLRRALEMTRSGVIVLEDGVYTGVDDTSFEFAGVLRLRSSSGDPTACILDGGNARRGPVLSGTSIAIEGVQFRNFVDGFGGTPSGAALHVESPTLPDDPGREEFILQNCIFWRNLSTADGGALFSARTTTIENCVFGYNRAAGKGGAIATGPRTGLPTADRRCCDSTTNSTFFENQAAVGSAIFNEAAEGYDLRRVLMVRNSGGLPYEGDFPYVECSNVQGNDGEDWTGVLAYYAERNGNFTGVPRFCDPNDPRLLVAPESPCLPANNTCNVLVGAGAACVN